MNTIELVQYITEMSQKGDYVAGHSIFMGRNIKPEQILNEGLIINDASRGLRFTARKFETEFKDNQDNLKDLASVTEEGVVIISIPGDLLQPYTSTDLKGFDTLSIILEDMNQYSKSYKDWNDNPTRMAKLPSIYILGYLDKKGIFVNNSNYAFDTDKRNKNISKLRPFLEQKYAEILKRSNSESISSQVKDYEEDIER